MPTYDFSFVRKTKGGGSQSSILLNQLQVAENLLKQSGGGELTPGDYDSLINMARSLQTNPGLTAAQRSEYDVKISGYMRDKTVFGQTKAGDISNMNNEISNDTATATMLAGNKPDLFLTGRASSLQDKLGKLSESIRQEEMSGRDSSQHLMEYNQTLRDFNDVLLTQQAHESWTGGADKNNPVPGYVAYVTTNNRGEIVKVDYGRYGSQNNYVETNGMVDGFQVYGKVNSKEGGKNVFLLGNNRFSAPDMMLPDPTNPGSMKVQRLVSESMQSGTNLTRGTQGYLPVDPAQLQMQSYIPRGSWARGAATGLLYQRREDGGYSKYLNHPGDLNPANVVDIPYAMEQNIMPLADETIDWSKPLMPGNISTTPNMGPTPSAPIPPATPPATSVPTPAPDLPNTKSIATAAPTSRITSPVTRSPQGALGYAQQTVQKAAGFVKGLFG